MLPLSRYTYILPDLVALIIAAAIQAVGALVLMRGPAAKRSSRRRAWTVAGVMISWALLAVGFLLRFYRVARYFPRPLAMWSRGLVVAWAVVSAFLVVALMISRAWLRLRPEHSPSRRLFLRTAQSALFCGPFAAAGYGVFIERTDLRLREQKLMFPDLPKDLDGLRLVQLTDIHLSPFLSEKELRRAVDMANETRAHIALVTGDLITFAGDPLDVCLKNLADLRADAGIFGCMGNHERYAAAEDYVEREGARLGLKFLRARSAQFRFGKARINMAGVDYQRKSDPYLVDGDRLVEPDSFNVLLSHNPDVFPVAARQGYHLTVAGHTHGGQIRVEILSQDLNVARFFTPYVDGEYRQGDSAIFVSRGIGTIGLPARFGAPPEVALLRLCRT